MNRTVCASAFLAAVLSILPGCIAAIGNTGYGAGAYPKSVAPLLEERVEAARRIVELRQAQVDQLRPLQEAGRGSAEDLIKAEIAVEEARLFLLECRAELSALKGRKDND